MQAPANPSLAIQGTPIVLLGASVRSAAESIRRAGCGHVVAIDQFGDSETLRATDSWLPLPSVDRNNLEAKLHAAGTRGGRLLISGGIYGGYEEWRESPMGFVGAAPEVFQQTDCPVFLKELARASEVGFPETTSRVSVASQWPTTGWLVKRRKSCGGVGVEFFVGKELDSGEYLQRRQRGRVLGATFVADEHGAELVGVCGLLTKRVHPRPFLFAGAIGPLRLIDSVLCRIAAIGSALMQRVPIQGPFNIDVVITGDHVTLLEVNPRWSASMEVLERSWMQRLDRPCSFFEPADGWRRRLRESKEGPVFWKRVIYARRDMEVSPQQFQDSSPRWEWTDTPSDVTIVEKGSPIATMIRRPHQRSKAFRISIREG
ncbi:MAG: ATP-grasp domain-containing protein [Planctomycetota bacterium]